MQFFKFLPLGLALAGGVVVADAQNESEAQKRAIEALRKKVAEMEQPAAAIPAPAPAASPAPAPAAPTAPASPDEKDLSEIHRRALEALHAQEPVRQAQPEGNVAVSPSTMTDREAEGRARLMLHEQQRAVDASRPRDSYERDLEARARAMLKSTPQVSEAPASAQPQASVEARAQELLRQQQIAETKTKKSAAQPEPASAPAPDASAAIHDRALQALHQSEVVAPAPVLTQSDNRAEVKPAEAAVTEAPKNNEGKKSASNSTKSKKTQGSNTSEKKPASKPLDTAVPDAATAAPPAAPLTKQQKLSDLLERYKADQVTPTQYQEERAKILAEP